MFAKKNVPDMITMTALELDDVIVNIISKMSNLSIKIVNLYGDEYKNRYIYSCISDSKFLDIKKLCYEIKHDEIKTSIDDYNYKILLFLENVL